MKKRPWLDSMLFQTEGYKVTSDLYPKGIDGIIDTSKGIISTQPMGSESGEVFTTVKDKEDITIPEGISLEKISVIRIEASDGFGIFMSNDIFDEPRKIKNIAEIAPDARIRHNKFPVPCLDKNLNLSKNNKNYFCAYKNLEQLEQWIKPEEIKLLIKAGYSVLMLEVTDYQKGEFQIVYTKESIVESKNINSLFI